MIQSTPPRRFFASNEFGSNLSLIKSTNTTKYILISMTTPLVDSLWLQLVAKIHVHVYIYTRRRKQSVEHKCGRQLFGMDVRGIRTSSQADAKEGYKLDGCVILSFGKSFTN